MFAFVIFGINQLMALYGFAIVHPSVLLRAIMAFQLHFVVSSGYKHVGSEMLPFKNYHVVLSVKCYRKKKIVLRAWAAYKNMLTQIWDVEYLISEENDVFLPKCMEEMKWQCTSWNCRQAVSSLLLKLVSSFAIMTDRGFQLNSQVCKAR